MLPLKGSPLTAVPECSRIPIALVVFEVTRSETCQRNLSEVKVIRNDLQCLRGLEVVFARAHRKQLGTGDFAESKVLRHETNLKTRINALGVACIV